MHRWYLPEQSGPTLSHFCGWRRRARCRRTTIEYQHARRELQNAEGDHLLHLLGGSGVPPAELVSLIGTPL